MTPQISYRSPLSPTFHVKGARVKIIGRRLFAVNLTKLRPTSVQQLARLLKSVVYQHDLRFYRPEEHIIYRGRIYIAEIRTVKGEVGTVDYNVPRWYEEFARDAFELVCEANMFVLSFDAPIIL